MVELILCGIEQLHQAALLGMVVLLVRVGVALRALQRRLVKFQITCGILGAVIRKGLTMQEQLAEVALFLPARQLFTFKHSSIINRTIGRIAAGILAAHAIA